MTREVEVLKDALVRLAQRVHMLVRVIPLVAGVRAMRADGASEVLLAVLLAPPDPTKSCLGGPALVEISVLFVLSDAILAAVLHVLGIV